jgi:hypothetical protein
MGFLPVLYMAKRLRNIRVRKIDLVGSPAIGKPIVLFKSQQGGDAVNKDELLKAIAELDDEAKQEVAKALGYEPPTDPIEVLKALSDEQRAEIAELLVGEQKAPTTAEDVIKAIAERMTPEDGGEPEVPDEVRKSIERLEERIAKADEAREQAETRVAELEKARRREVYIAEAQSFQKLPGVNPDDFAGILEKADASLDEAERKKLREVLTGANKSIADSEMLKEYGSSELESLATELMKSKTDLTKEQAKAKVMSAKPELVERMLAEEDEQKGVR